MKKIKPGETIGKTAKYDYKPDGKLDETIRDRRL